MEENMISGFATLEGTEQFANNSDANQLNFKKIQHLTLSMLESGPIWGILMKRQMMQ